MSGRGTGSPVPRMVGTSELRRLSRRQSLRAAWAIGRQWVVIMVVIGATATWGPWYVYPLAIVVIATRQHAIAVLMHDGAHASLFRRRWLNDLISDLFLAFPLFVSTTLYRRHHLDHHRYLNTERDPDLDAAALQHTSAEWRRLFLGDVTGLNLLKTVDTLDQFSLLPVLRGNRTVAAAMGRNRLTLFACCMLALAAVLTLTGGWLAYLLLWILPSLTALSLILRLRAVAEHVGCDLDAGIGGTRTVLAGLVEQFLFSPCRINYHLAHHLFPSVPFYNLPELHRHLMRCPEVSARARISHSYLFGSASVMNDIARARQSRVIAYP